MADAELSIEGSFWLASLPISGPQTPLGAVSKMIQMQHGAQRLAVCLIGAVKPVRDFCLIQAGTMTVETALEGLSPQLLYEAL